MLVGITVSVRAKRRPAPSFPLQSSLAIESRRQECRCKKLDERQSLRQQGKMFHLPFHFVRDVFDLKNQLFRSSSSLARTASEWAH
jgi:hypothetical protein